MSTLLRLGVLLLAIAVAVPCNAVFAQTEEDNKSSSVITLDSVKVTAMRTEHTLDEIPMTVNVLTAEDIENSSFTSVADMLTQFPGIRLHKAGNPALPTIMVRGESADRTLILIDGVPFKEEHNITPGAVLTISPSDIERIEVIKGPAGAIYGSDGIGGVVKIITKKGSRKPLTVNYRGLYDESANGYEHSLGMGGSYNGFFYRGSFVTADFDQMKSRAVGSSTSIYTGKKITNSNYERQSYAGVVGYEWSKGSISINGDRFEQKSGTSTVNRRNRNTTGLNAELSNLIPYLEKLNFAYNYQETDKKTDSSYTVNGYGSYANLQTEWMVIGNNYLTAGIEYSDNDVREHRYSGSGRILKGETKDVALYVQDEWSAMDNLVFTLGGRYTWYERNLKEAINSGRSTKDNDEENFALSAGVVYHPVDDIALRASYSQGFKVPTMYQMYFGSDETAMINMYYGTFVPNQNLDPEKNYQIEIGSMITKDWFTADLAVFYMDAEDYIVMRQYTENGSNYYQYQNVQGAQTYGAEFMTKAVLGDFTPYAGVAWTKRKYNYGNGFKTWHTRVPEFDGNIGVRYDTEFLGRNWYADLVMNWASAAQSKSSKTTAATKYKEWHSFDLQIGMRGKMEEGTYFVNLNLVNLADAKYETTNSTYVFPGFHVVLSGGFNF